MPFSPKVKRFMTNLICFILLQKAFSLAQSMMSMQLAFDKELSWKVASPFVGTCSIHFHFHFSFQQGPKLMESSIEQKPNINLASISR